MLSGLDRCFLTITYLSRLSIKGERVHPLQYKRGGSPCQYVSSHSWQAKMKLINKYSAIFCHYHPFLFILPNNKDSFFQQPKFHFVIVFDSAFWPRWVMQSDKLALAIVASSLTQTCRACWVSGPKTWKIFWKNSDTLEVWTWFPCQWEKQKK